MSKRAKGTEYDLGGRSMLTRWGEEIETVTRKEEARPQSHHYPRAR